MLRLARAIQTHTDSNASDIVSGGTTEFDWSVRFDHGPATHTVYIINKKQTKIETQCLVAVALLWRRPQGGGTQTGRLFIESLKSHSIKQSSCRILLFSQNRRQTPDRVVQDITIKPLKPVHG